MTSTFGCPHCGSSNPLRATFCGSCGAYLQGIDATELGPQRPADEKAESPPRSPAPPPPDPADRADPTRTQPWLRPDFDEPDAPPPQDATTARQPWLQPEQYEREQSTPPTPRPQRLLGGLQRLIEPLHLDPRSQAAATLPPSPSGPPPELPDEMQRQLRAIFTSDVPIQDESPPALTHIRSGAGQGLGLLRREWVYALLLAALLFGLWADNAGPESRPHAWPGVESAFTAIENLPTGSVVLVNWAYDPSFAGEMDQAVLPVLEHLLRQDLRLVFISQLPGGPATARRMLAAASRDLPSPRQAGSSPIQAGYLPGGVSALPLLGEAPARSLPADIQGRTLTNRESLAALETGSAGLLLIVAASAEEVQRWLEQIQPLNPAPLVAVTSAAADPPLRPYADSGQIVGLVSGYAGGIAYRQRLGDLISSDQQESQRRQISAQNWALAVLLLVAVAGNLSALYERREP